ncbi:MAG: beta-ketoacyl synthase N-terminal-like domain-containing protein, partial [Trichodesmium sp. St5_bin8]|nr:beta-ketoacyl synthase N-terminal-like domain-containing protein [Trichodesmium sp. St4_bin8_1]MDE5071291.1 beta-ketoacyl synthase N-terminal-like domain-containing protein [Trichodesmium sp. St5_bin8]
MSNNKSRLDRDIGVAVIGMGCHYPGARKLKDLWQNILSKRQQFRQIPDVRLPSSQYYDPNLKIPDKTYGNKASV